MIDIYMENIITILYVKVLLFINFSYTIIAEFFKNTKTSSNTVLRTVSKTDSPKKLKRISSSLEHLCQYDHYDNLDHPTIFNVKLSLQTRNKCEKCNLKLYHNQKRYFAFDREYCYFCWNKLSNKIVSSCP